MYFVFRLAQTLSMPVGELSERVTYAELIHWLAFLDEESERAKPPEKRRSRRRLTRKELKNKADAFVIWGNARHARQQAQQKG